MTVLTTSNINFSMSGSVRRQRDNFFIDLTWRSERLRLFSDREGNPFFSERQANRVLERIRSEIDGKEFNPKNYIGRELKALRLESYALAWLERQRLRLEAGEISHGYMREIRATVKNHLIPHLGTRDIRCTNKGHLDDFLVELAVGPKSKKNILGVLRAIFTDAVDREDLLQVPKFPKVKAGKPSSDCLILRSPANLIRWSRFVRITPVHLPRSIAWGAVWDCARNAYRSGAARRGIWCICGASRVRRWPFL